MKDKLREFFERSGQALNVEALFHSNLWIKHYRGGALVEERELGAGLITNVGVNLWAADWNNTNATIKLANWHDSGTGVTTPTISDTVMQTPTGNARIAGVQSNSNNIYQTIATLSYGATFNITEWGLLTAVTSGTLFDHRTFTVINCVNGDTVQFTYQLTIVSGG